MADAAVNSDIVVDIAGTTFVEGFVSIGLNPISTGMFFDANGSLIACKAIRFVPEVAPRVDAPGFLVTTVNMEDENFPQIERWDGSGQTNWTLLLPRLNYPARVEPAADGGALAWAYKDPLNNDWTNQLLRIGADGQLLRRSNLYASGRPGCGGADIREDQEGRVLFSADATCNADGLQYFGLINSDGTLAWSRSEARLRSTILYSGSGDFWRFVGIDSVGQVTTVQRWTPWGLLLAQYGKPTLVPGVNFMQPVIDGDDVWFLSKNRNRVYLANLGVAGIGAQLELDPSTGSSTIEDSTFLSAAGGAAWVLSDSILGAQVGSTIHRATRAGLSWRREYPGLKGLSVVATDQGTARMLFRDPNSSRPRGWLVSVDARTGKERWRTSVDDSYRVCNSPPGSMASDFTSGRQ